LPTALSYKAHRVLGGLRLIESSIPFFAFATRIFASGETPMACGGQANGTRFLKVTQPFRFVQTFQYDDQDFSGAKPTFRVRI